MNWDDYSRSHDVVKSSEWRRGFWVLGIPLEPTANKGHAICNEFLWPFGQRVDPLKETDESTLPQTWWWEKLSCWKGRYVRLPE